MTGLATAYYLQQEAVRKNLDVSYSVLEASDRWGGKIVTETVNGFLMEGGPDSFITRKPWALELVRELGLEDQILETPEQYGKVYLLRQGRLVELPSRMMFVIPTDLTAFLRSDLLSLFGRLRVLREMVWSRRREAREESLADFVRRRFGAEALTGLAEPLMAGIHAADPERLSLEAAFPLVAKADGQFSSLIRGLRKAHRRAGPADAARTRNSSRVTLRGGLQDLVTALRGRLDPASLHLGRKVRRIETTAAGFSLHTEQGTIETADAVVLTTPTYLAADQVKEAMPALADGLRGIRYVSSATVSLGFARDAVRRPLDGLGFVVPRREGRRIRACTWASSKFEGRAPEGHVLLRAFVGGSFSAGHVFLEDDELQALVLEELGDIVGLSDEPKVIRIRRWPMGIPQLDIGHADRVRRIQESCPDGLLLAGNAYAGVGLPDSILSAREAAQAISERYAAETH